MDSTKEDKQKIHDLRQEVLQLKASLADFEAHSIYIHRGSDIKPAHPINVLEYNKVCTDCLAVSLGKNHDYATAVDVIGTTGVRGLVTRMFDKSARLLSLSNKDTEPRVQESLYDTASDLVNYSIYLCMVLKGTW